MTARTIAVDEPLSKRELEQVIAVLRGPASVDEDECAECARGDVGDDHLCTVTIPQRGGYPTGWYVDRDGKDGEVTVTVKFLTTRRAEVDIDRYVDDRNLFGDDDEESRS